jgi:hypothetical protein
MPFHSIGDVSATSPRLVCHSFVKVSGPGVPAVSLLAPLRAESCSSSGQSSSVAAGVDVGVDVGAGVEVGDDVAVAVAVGFAVAVAVAAGVGLGFGVTVADGAAPCPLHAQSSAAATIAEKNTRG